MEQEKKIIRETDAEAIRLARTLLRTARYGALAVLDPQSGAPLASRVAVATDLDGTPLILVSSLSEHTGGLDADPRCSLLLGEPGKGDPLAHPRISLRCRAERLQRGTPAQIARRAALPQPPSQGQALCRLRRFRILPPGGRARQPQWRLRQGLSFDEGRARFRRSGNRRARRRRAAGARPYERRPQRRHRRLCARLRQGRGDGWSLTGIDAEGIDIACGDDFRRVFFAEPLGSAGELRQTLVGLAQQGRRSIAETRD